MYLAQLNVGRLRHPIGDPRVAEFADNIERVNAAAARMPGFVWMLKDESGGATGFRVNDDPRFIVNLTVWESAEHLQKFVFGVVHRHFYERRALWFEALAEQHLVFWRIEPGARPSLEEAVARLEHLRANGPSAFAFGWAEAIGECEIAALRCGG